MSWPNPEFRVFPDR